MAVSSGHFGSITLTKQGSDPSPVVYVVKTTYWELFDVRSFAPGTPLNNVTQESLPSIITFKLFVRGFTDTLVIPGAFNTFLVTARLFQFAGTLETTQKGWVKTLKRTMDVNGVARIEATFRMSGKQTIIWN